MIVGVCCCPMLVNGWLMQVAAHMTCVGGATVSLERDSQSDVSWPWGVRVDSWWWPETLVGVLLAARPVCLPKARGVLSEAGWHISCRATDSTLLEYFTRTLPSHHLVATHHFALWPQLFYLWTPTSGVNKEWDSSSQVSALWLNFIQHDNNRCHD